MVYRKAAQIKTTAAVTSQRMRDKLFLPGCFLPEAPVPKLSCLGTQVFWLYIGKAKLSLLSGCIATKAGYLSLASLAFTYSRAEVAYLLVEVCFP